MRGCRKGDCWGLLGIVGDGRCVKEGVRKRVG